MASLRVEHNQEQGTTEALSQPFVVFVNDNPTPRYRLTHEQAYELLTSLQRALGMTSTRSARCSRTQGPQSTEWDRIPELLGRWTGCGALGGWTAV
jgi:hypothetical protein